MAAGFSDDVLQLSDAGGSQIAVFNPRTGFTIYVDGSIVQQYMDNQRDTSEVIAYNLSVRAKSGGGISNILNADGSVNAAALAYLNTISFKIPTQ